MACVRFGPGYQCETLVGNNNSMYKKMKKQKSIRPVSIGNNSTPIRFEIKVVGTASNKALEKIEKQLTSIKNTMLESIQVKRNDIHN